MIKIIEDRIENLKHKLSFLEHHIACADESAKPAIQFARGRENEIKSFVMFLEFLLDKILEE